MESIETLRLRVALEANIVPLNTTGDDVYVYDSLEQKFRVGGLEGKKV